MVIGDNQHFKGYTLFLYKDHKTELFHLETIKKMKFLEEMSIVAEAVSKAFNAEKMNYELLGNGDTHLHWHLSMASIYEKIRLKPKSTLVSYLKSHLFIRT